MSIPKKYVEENIDSLFIAYSNIYIEDALKALKLAPDAEAVIMQPYESEGRFVSTREAIEIYKQLKDNRDIPILFTPQGRMAETGQFFEYGARLFDVFDLSVNETRKLIQVILDTGKWVLHAEDNLYAKKEILVVKSPIVELPDKIPIESATNILRNQQGKPTRAVSIPAPKLIKESSKGVLQTL